MSLKVGASKTCPRGLDRIISAVCGRHVVFGADDIFRISAMIMTDKHLQLGNHKAFMQGLHDTLKNIDISALSPFQASQVQQAFARAGYRDEQASPATSSAVLAVRDNPIEAHIEALRETAAKLWADRSFDAARAKLHIEGLKQKLGQLTATQLVQFVVVLSRIHHNDYNLASVLARRACELSSSMSCAELALAYHHLHQIGAQDSLIAIASRIESHGSEMTLLDCAHVAKGIEKQPILSRAALPLCTLIVQRVASGAFDESKSDLSLLKSMLVAASRCGLRQNAAVRYVVGIVTRKLDSASDRHLHAAFQAVVDLEINDPATTTLFLKRAVQLAPTMELKFLESIIDLLSVLKVDSSAFMDAALNRLTADCGALNASQIHSVFNTIASYPPAKGHPVVPALSLAACFRKTSFDRDAVADIVLSLAELGFVGDEYYSLADFLFSTHNGFKSPQQFIDWLTLSSQDQLSDPRANAFVNAAVNMLAPAMTQEEVAQTKQLLLSRHVGDDSLARKLLARKHIIQREQAEREEEDFRSRPSQNWRRGGSRGRGRGGYNSNRGFHSYQGASNGGWNN